MSLELWLFAVVMEVIVIGTFFGGTFMAYSVGRRQSVEVAEQVHARIAPAPQRGGASGTPIEMKDRTAPAA